jgi:hypothetical protein
MNMDVVKIAVGLIVNFSVAIIFIKKPIWGVNLCLRKTAAEWRRKAYKVMIRIMGVGILILTLSFCYVLIANMLKGGV